MENNINNISKKPAEQNGVGPVIGSMIVIIVVIVGGVYFWGTKIIKDRQSAEIENQAMSASADADLNNDVNVNELDIPNEDLNNLDKEIKNP